MDINELASMEIGLASPETIRSWSHGEVTKPETINYRSQKPEPGGLFCEVIFGPSKDYECHCGKYKKIRFQGITCEKCGVQVISKEFRRERFGHIELVSPCTHIWYLKGIPSRIGLALDISPKQLEEVVYFAAHIILKGGDPEKTSFLTYKKFIDEKTGRELFSHALGELLEKGVIAPDSHDADRAQEMIERLGNLTEAYDFLTVSAFLHRYTGAEFGQGAAAIKRLLHEIDLDAEYKQINEDLRKATTAQNRLKLAKRLEVIQAFRNSGQKPEWMVLDVIPVIPPDLRPMLQLDGGRFAASDLNDLYRRVISRNNRLKKLIEASAPPVILSNEKRMLQEAVDALIDNGRRSKPVSGPSGRALKSLSSGLKGKQGRFRQNLLGKRVDYSGRSVIAVGPELKMYQCGIPREMAIYLLRPFIASVLMKEQQISAHKTADKIIDRYEPIVYDIVDRIISQHPVLLNRAPTLHRLGIQAFQPVLVDGHAIRLHPLVCTGFNADFDGDQMAVHVPLSKEAQEEALNLMLASNNILGPKDGKPIVVPGQDMILGNYYLTSEENPSDFKASAKRLGELKISSPDEKEANDARIKECLEFAEMEGSVFSSVSDVQSAYDAGIVSLHNRIAIPAEKIHKTFAPADDPNNTSDFSLPNECRGKYLLTTVGKVIFNEIFPDDFIYINDTPTLSAEEIKSWFVPRGTNIKEALASRPLHNPIKKKDLGTIIDLVFHKYDMNEDPVVNRVHRVIDLYEQKQIDVATAISEIHVIVDEDATDNKNGEGINFGRHNHVMKLLDNVILDYDDGKLMPEDVMKDVKKILAMPYPSKTSAVLDKIKDQGFKYSTISSVTVAISDIDSVEGKEELVASYRAKVERVNHLANDKGMLSEDERHKTVVDLWKKCTSEVSDIVEKATKDPKMKSNPVIIMKESGSRGSKDNFAQLEGMKGLVAAARGSAHEDYVYEMPIVSSYRNGLTIAEYFHNTHGSRKGGADTALKTADSGYLTRRLVDVAQDVVVREEDCHCDHGFKVRTIMDTSRNKVIEPLHDRLVGRFSMRDVVDPNTGEVLCEGNTLITTEIADKIVNAGIKEVEIRSLFTCQTKDGVCQKCYGLNNATGHLVELGEAVGIMAAQSIGEPGTQLTMRVFHTGGMAQTDITQGLPRVQELVEARNPKGEALISEIDGKVASIEHDPSGRHIVTIESSSEWTAESLTTKETKTYTTNIGARLRVKVGDHVEAGGKIAEGAINPKDLLEYSDVEKVEVYMIKEIQKVYEPQGINISDKHLEVIVRQMLRKMYVIDAGDTNLLPGTRVDVMRFTLENQKVLKEGKRPAVARPLILGITKAALETTSFLSAASFQETTRVLTDAAIKMKTDPLHGLKENVITGKLIPAGTGLLTREEESERLKDFDVLTHMKEVKAQYIEAHDRQEVVDA